MDSTGTPRTFLMSKIPPKRSRIVAAKRTYTIVASRFNSVYVQGLVDHVSNQIMTDNSSAMINLHEVPGAFEIPIVVREIAKQQKPDVIIAVGVIIKGKTDHAEHLARTVIDGLQRIALESGVPVINVVLSMKNEAQARERCLEDEINRGTEAAHAAAEIAQLMSELREKQQQPYG